MPFIPRLETVGLGRRMDIDWSTKSWLSNVTYFKASTAALIKRPSASALSQFHPMYDSLLVMDQMPSLEDKYTLNHLTSDDASDHAEASESVEVAGYYFPSCKRPTSVIKVTVTWSDNHLSFTASRTPLPADHVAKSIKADLEREIGRWRGMRHGSPMRFVLPLTSSFVHESFGDRSVQILSGHSVVILDQRQILKCNLIPAFGHRLLQLFSVGERGPQLERSLLPNGRMIVEGKEYFTYKLLLKPIDRYEARIIFGGEDRFADGVFKALHELHDTCSLAHMDLRLENVCFDPVNHQPILIDLDRSAPKDDQCYYHHLPSTSTMYRPRDQNWVLENIDLLQVGLMFCHILDMSIDSSYDDGTFDYNRYYPTTQSIHPYLRSLLDGQWPSESDHANFISDPKFVV